MKPNRPTLSPIMIEDAVRAALREDLGRAGDITTLSTIAPDAKASVVLNSREHGIVAGMDIAAAAFAAMDRDLVFTKLVEDGDKVTPKMDVATIEGTARAILSAERVALNFLMHLSGIATYTAAFAEKIAHTSAQVTCTRKTIPGLRTFEKYAVRCGGGSNHRYGLDDAILIKDNHIAVAGGVAKAVEAARSYIGHLVKIEVEVDNLTQMEEALTAHPDVILLDNMGPDVLREAVKINQGRATLEASGGVNIDTIASLAETGVDYISTSKITMSAPTLDLGLDINLR